MKPAKLLGVLVPLLLGLAAAAWTPLALWFDMKEGLIAFLGFLSASLVQVMPLTANFLQSDKLSVRDAIRLTDSLTKQQYYWVGLLCATIFALVVVIVGAALKQFVDALEPLFSLDWIEVRWSALVTFLIASSVSFVIVKMLGLFQGMLSLHRLRTELIIDAAKKDAADKARRERTEACMPAPTLPDGYGEIVPPSAVVL